MIVGLDGSRAFLKERTGIEEYSYQVIKNLKENLKSVQVFLYIRSGQKVDFPLPQNWKIKIIHWSYFWTQFGLSLEILLHPIDTLFIPAHVLPVVHPKNSIVTVHGLEYEFVPEAYSLWERIYMRWAIKNSCRQAKTIIAVSNNTKRDLVKLYDIKAEKIKVVYEGYANNDKFPMTNDKSILNNKISKPYLLFVGRIEARKNIVGILEAYKILIEKYKLPHALVLAGAPGFGYDIIKLKIKNYFKIQNSKLKIIELGYVDNEKKQQLLANADAFLFPTLYEGFGLPILEAQSVGVPVVASNNSSISEVTMGSAILIDPHNPSEIIKAVYELISNKELKNDIINKGYENIKRFSWEKCAMEISNLLEN